VYLVRKAPPAYLVRKDLQGRKELLEQLEQSVRLVLPARLGPLGQPDRRGCPAPLDRRDQPAPLVRQALRVRQDHKAQLALRE